MRRSVFMAVTAVAMLALAGCGQVDDLLAMFSGEEGVEEAGSLAGSVVEVLLEPVGEVGPDPFTDSVAREPDEDLWAFAERGTPDVADPQLAAERSNPADALVQQDGYLAISGAEPGLYGGTRDAASCDPEQMVDFLEQHPDRAQAWADVHGIEPDEIRDFLADTTAVNLGADTRVLNHGFADGVATPREAVLQRGKAVMVDSRGVPVVNCECGNPMLAPTITADETYTGSRWENFREDVILEIEPAADVIDALEVTDYVDGTRFERPLGSNGDQDQPIGPSSTQASDEPGDAPEGLGGTADGCPAVERRETGDVFTLDLTGGVDCDEIYATAVDYVNDSMGIGAEFGPWWCGPASAAALDAGIAVSCHHDDGRQVDLLIEEDPATDPSGDPSYASPHDMDPERCGPVRTTIGSWGQGPIEGFDLVVRAAEPCDIVEQVATAFLDEVEDWGMAGGSSDALPYEAMVLGWECTTGTTIGTGDDFMGCRLHNGEFQMVALN